MTTESLILLVGGLGMFLLGIHHLTEGLKGLAGDSMRQVLQNFVGGRFSSIASGAVFTALIQSSSAATLTVIGFVSAGLVTFSQAVGVIVGATFGTTATPWLVAIFGFRLSISSFALPILGIGAFLWLIGKGRSRSAGAILAGFGLIFVGIEYMQDGMADISWDLEDFAGSGLGARWLLGLIGVVMTIVMQSSSAAAATTLVALHAGSLTFDQGCAMIVGQSVGTAATSALAATAGGLAVRQAALAHIVFSLVVGILGMLLLTPIADLAGWIGAQLDDPDGVLALAAFSSIFKFAGILAFYPWLDRFSATIANLTGRRTESAVSRLGPTLAEAGGSIAVEAAWRATLEAARTTVDEVQLRLAGRAPRQAAQESAVPEIEAFLESLCLETTDLDGIEPRLVRLRHALEHLTQLNEDLARVPPPLADWERPAAMGDGQRALAAWLDVTADAEGACAGDAVNALAAASRQMSAEGEATRMSTLEDVALQRLSAATARGVLDQLNWADAALSHSFRLADSLRTSAGP